LSKSEILAIVFRWIGYGESAREQGNPGGHLA
jgi:hypothetical protein